MDYTYKKIIEHDKSKKILCISIETKLLSFNNFPDFIREFIIKSLEKNQKLVIFTDEILYNELQILFKNYSSEFFNKDKVCIKLYNPLTLNLSSKELLEILKYTAKTDEEINILWDFKNLGRSKYGLLNLIKYIENIFSYSNYKVTNLIYINSFDYNLLKKVCNKFDYLVVFNKSKELCFKCNNSINNILWILNSNSQLEHQNTNLVVFNEMFSTISKTTTTEEFKNFIVKKIKDICNIDFCIMYTSEKDKKDLKLDSCFGITKRHEYYIKNNINLTKYNENINYNIRYTNSSMYVEYDSIKDNNIKNLFLTLKVNSCIVIPVEYYNHISGVIWIGKYHDSPKMDENDVKYIESICKTAFYLVQEQDKFLSLHKKLIENEKLRAMGEMAAGIAHDFNNILTPIIGCIQLLKDCSIEERNIIKQLKIIEICAYDGMNIANKVKRFTKEYNNKNNLEIFNIDDIVLDAIDLTKNKWLTESALRGININIISVLKSQARVKGNPTEIREVFINIVRNAIDSMENGGNIEINTSNKLDNVVIQIKDSGTGMSEDVAKRVFEPFFTTKGNKGSGLGLSLSYKIIQYHNGEIKVKSEKGVGTNFYIELPICNNVIEEKSSIKWDNVQFSGNVLVVDDQQQIRSVISDMVKSIVNCKIKSCGDSNIKEELSRRKYDIVICDFSMPKINGIQVCELVKEINKSTFFCLMTGWVGNFSNGMIKKVDFILNKPINKEKLKEMFVQYNNKQ